ncbi:MAG: AMP-binding protein [Woeseia sp.]|nr:AMP-binding protein [Woeseia sp.]
MSWFQPAQPMLPDILRNNAEQRASQAAVICGDTKLSWQAFHTDLNRVANALRNEGLENGDRVAILMQNSVEMLEAMLGVMCAGLVAVPLNVSVSDEGIEKQINNCDARAVIASDEHTARIEAMRKRLPAHIDNRLIAAPAARAGWLHLDALMRKASETPPNVSISPQQPCNIIYSSGTTGLPKGIVHSYACRMAWAYNMSIALRYHCDTRALISLGLYSNITWVTLLSAILCGGTLVLMPAFDVVSCLQLIERERISHSSMVPVQFQRLLASPDFNDFDLSSIEALMCCGSPLHADLKQEIVSRIPGDFIELYGLTEGLVTTQSPIEAASNPRSVGRPCPGQSLKILDGNDQPLPAGESGEIVGHGDLLMSGYLNRDEANAEATWKDEHGRTWLRTGDIGRLDEDGNLYLVDRKKDMIISGGQNIYPADIESVIAQNNDVFEVAVVGVRSERWGEAPIAVVTGDAIDTEALLQWTNERVGRQQKIAAVAIVAELPRNPNGKVLKRELRVQFADILDQQVPD